MKCLDQSFAGGGQYDWFIERVPAREAVSAIERWKQMQREGWDIEALTYDNGGQVTELVGLGCLYCEQLSLEASA